MGKQNAQLSSHEEEQIRTCVLDQLLVQLTIVMFHWRTIGEFNIRLKSGGGWMVAAVDIYCSCETYVLTDVVQL